MRNSFKNIIANCKRMITYIIHRTSYDLDFFSFKAFSCNRLSQKMTGLFNLGALCNFDDYGDLPQWIKDTLLTLIDPA